MALRPKKTSPKKPKGRKPARGRAGLRDEVVSTVKRMLPVPIDEKETRKKEHRIAKALTEKKEEQELMNAEILPRRKRLKELEGEVETLRSQVIKGTEDREVVCDIVKDYKRMYVVVRRRDNDEIVEERVMTAEDRQEDIESRTKRPKAVDGEGKPTTDEDEAEQSRASTDDPGDDDEEDDDEPEVH